MRQLASRARKHVQAARPRFPVAPEEGERIARAFFAAASSGDVDGLKALLAETVVIQSDGGGKVLAFLNPIVGVRRVLRLYRSLHRKFGDGWTHLVRPVRVDGLPGYISRERGGIVQTTAFAIERGRITGIYITRNPDKLRGISALIGNSDEPGIPVD